MTKIYSRTVIYDGECGFCLRWVNWAKRLDWLGRLEWRARLDPATRAAFPQISDEKSRREMVSIRPDGKVYGGFYACRDILRHLPLTFLPALLLYLPGMALVGAPAYRWVAENRHRFGKASCSVKGNH